MNKTSYLFRLSGFLLLSAMYFGCSSVDPGVEEMIDPNEMDPEAMLEEAPGFSLTSISGAQVALSDFDGKPLVIFFFGNSCPLCIGSAPSLQSDIREMFAEEDVAMIGIDVWDGNQASVVGFKDRTGVTFDLLLMGSQVGSDYATTYDRLFVLNGDGEFVFKGEQSAGSDIDNAIKAIEDIL